MNEEDFKWAVEALEYSDDPLDWKQGLATLAFITTEPYGKNVKDDFLIPLSESW